VRRSTLTPPDPTALHCISTRTAVHTHTAVGRVRTPKLQGQATRTCAPMRLTMS
jgi:hypothetical protein